MKKEREFKDQTERNFYLVYRYTWIYPMWSVVVVSILFVWSPWHNDTAFDPWNLHQVLLAFSVLYLGYMFVKKPKFTIVLPRQSKKKISRYSKRIAVISLSLCWVNLYWFFMKEWSFDRWPSYLFLENKVLAYITLYGFLQHSIFLMFWAWCGPEVSKYSVSFRVLRKGSWI